MQESGGGSIPYGNIGPFQINLKVALNRYQSSGYNCGRPVIGKVISVAVDGCGQLSVLDRNKLLRGISTVLLIPDEHSLISSGSM